MALCLPSILGDNSDSTTWRLVRHNLVDAKRKLVSVLTNIIFTAGDPPRHCDTRRCTLAAPGWRRTGLNWFRQIDRIIIIVKLIKLRRKPPVRDDTGEVDGGATINVQVGRTLDPHVRNCNRIYWLFALFKRKSKNYLRPVGHWNLCDWDVWGIWANYDIEI